MYQILLICIKYIKISIVLRPNILSLKIIIVCLETLFNKTWYHIETGYIHCKLLAWFLYERVLTERNLQTGYGTHFKKQSLRTVKKVF